MALLALQAAWIALSGRYPMAFDEDFHVGIIRLYAHHVSPFWSGHPAGADAFGAVARDPSYLYQWLMSFPYRVISAFTANQVIQVLVLRFINIGLFAGGLVIYRRLLSMTGASKAAINFCLLIFVLLPVTPLLAAQINYDNLFLPVTGLALLLTVRLADEIRVKKRINGRSAIILAIVCLLASLVKFAFLPIFVAIAVYLAVVVYKTLPRKHRLAVVWERGMGRMGWLLVLGLVLSTSLFAERYGLNFIRYHTPVPACEQVLTKVQCTAYAPWARDSQLVTIKTDSGHLNAASFNFEWFYGMWFRLFFAVDGPASNFETRGPLLVPAVSALIAAPLLIVVAIWQSKRLIRRYRPPVFGLFSLASLFYLVALWLQEYKSYLQTGQPVAINGRYLLPVLLFGLLFGVLALNELLKDRARLKLAMASVAIVSLLWGGGALTYILRSRDGWYWDNSAVRRANHEVQKIAPLVPGHDKPVLFLRTP